MKLSIIIPVYNAENYLHKCLESVFNQDLSTDEYEVLCINDGSTDRSENILLDFAKRHTNLIYIKQNNQGVSVARNQGLDRAKGEYITYVDSDDEIFNNSIHFILEKLSKENLDILYPEIFFISEETTEKVESIGNDSIVEKGILHQRRTYTATFYKKEIIKNLFFNEEISFGEDTIFNAIAQSRAEKVSYISIPYYKYFNRENSLTKKAFSDDVYQSIYKVIDILEQEKVTFNNRNRDSDNYFEKVQKVFIQRISELFIIKNFSKRKYNELIGFLESKKIKFLLQDLERKYPFYGKSWSLFYFYQKYIQLKSIVYHTFVR